MINFWMKAGMVLFFSVLSLTLVGCGMNYTNYTGAPPAASAPAATGSKTTVTIVTDQAGMFGFTPQTLTVPVGTTVTWKNGTQAAHTVTSDDGKTFDSGAVAAGGTFTFTFSTAGSYAYHCDIHPYMKATIIVK